MLNNNPLLNTDNQFVLSYEVLSLLQWITEHDTPKLKKIIATALKTGLKEEMVRFRQLSDNERTLDAQATVIEFFGLLEALIHETTHEQAEQSETEKHLMPILEQIDTTACDTATVRTSVERATARLTTNPHDDPQEALCKELLKLWKPTKKSALN